MARLAKRARLKRLRCTTCHKDVPGSEANVSEAQDYLVHFCGLDCFNQWWMRSHPRKPSEAAPRVHG